MESTSFSIQDFSTFKQKALAWAERFPTVCYLDNNQYPHYKQQRYECLLAVDARESLVASIGSAFDDLKAFYDKQPRWLFGFFTYDLKNETHIPMRAENRLLSEGHDGIGMPDLLFFEPRYLIEISEDKVTINRNYPEAFAILEMIQAMEVPQSMQHEKPELQYRIPKNEYIETVQAVRQHIEEGDVYELNFCQEIYAEGAEISPLAVFNRLNTKAKAPFSAFVKYEHKYLLCSSPERFMMKQGKQLTSQPIKGTIRRGDTDEEDQQLKAQLQADLKERAENVMIVDLVRNDLTKSAVTGSIKVPELFGVYTFEQVNQLISTVTAQLRDGLHFIDAIRNAFPMGSMTGAPKFKAMQLIEHYERTKRGLYSGAVGYITPNGDFDFNVVIRSILYNALSHYLSIQVGGAITYDSIPEKEYEESLLKAKALLDVLG